MKIELSKNPEIGKFEILRRRKIRKIKISKNVKVFEEKISTFNRPKKAKINQNVNFRLFPNVNAISPHCALKHGLFS